MADLIKFLLYTYAFVMCFVTAAAIGLSSYEKSKRIHPDMPPADYYHAKNLLWILHALFFIALVLVLK